MLMNNAYSEILKSPELSIYMVVCRYFDFILTLMFSRIAKTTNYTPIQWVKKRIPTSFSGLQNVFQLRPVGYKTYFHLFSGLQNVFLLRSVGYKTYPYLVLWSPCSVRTRTVSRDPNLAATWRGVQSYSSILSTYRTIN